MGKFFGNELVWVLFCLFVLTCGSFTCRGVSVWYKVPTQSLCRQTTCTTYTTYIHVLQG